MSYQQLECDYFNLYNQFISVDFQISLTEKRNRALIKDFIFFYHQILKQKDLSYLLGVRNKIALEVQNYMQEHQIVPKNLGQLCIRENGHIEFFKLFYKALGYLISFRQKLSKEQKIQIVANGISEHFDYHFVVSDLEELQNFYQNNIFILPEKCLNSFHIAMLHLCIIVLNPLEFKPASTYLRKSINALKDGTLKIYELILKEYFLLYPNDKILKNEFKKIKQKEFELLSNNKYFKDKFLKNYKELCEEILYNLELEKLS